MISTNITIGLILTLATGACAVVTGNQGASARRSEPSTKITEAQRTALLDLGGETLVADATMIMALDMTQKEGQYQARQCFRKFLLANKQERESVQSPHGLMSARGNFRSCVVMCESAKKRSSDASLLDFAERFVETCQGRQDLLDGARHLVRAEKTLKALVAASGSVNQYYRDSEVRGALKQANEALGPENVELVALKASYQVEYASRSKAIRRVAAFMSKPAVREMRSQIDRLRAEVDALRADAKYSEHSRVLFEQRSSDLRAAESKYSHAMTRAKL